MFKCMNFSASKLFKSTLVLVIIDLIVIWLWAINSYLGPGSAMGMYIDIPIAFLVNLLIGVTLFFIRRAYSPMFFINCIIAPVITYWLFTAEMHKQYKEHITSWTFNLQDTTFNITKWNKLDQFSVSFIIDSGSSISFLDGKCEQKKDTLLLISDSTRMYIHQHKLYNFRNSKNPIVLKDR